MTPLRPVFVPSYSGIRVLIVNGACVYLVRWWASKPMTSTNTIMYYVAIIMSYFNWVLLRLLHHRYQPLVGWHVQEAHRQSCASPSNQAQVCPAPTLHLACHHE